MSKDGLGSGVESGVFELGPPPTASQEVVERCLLLLKNSPTVKAPLGSWGTWGLGLLATRKPPLKLRSGP